MIAATEITLLQAAAALILWRSRQFDTCDIASALNLPEAVICRVLHAARQREFGPDLHLVEDYA
jgi:hypothetical protein